MNKRKGLILFLIAIVLFSSVASSCLLLGEGNKIALIRLSGTIAEGSQGGFLTSGGITPSRVRSYLQQASGDSSIKAVVLRIDSPGGTAAASQEIATMVREFEKPVVISMGDIAASGGYYISAYADKIVAEPSTTTGSIGVIIQIIYIEGLLEKLGLEMEIIK